MRITNNTIYDNFNTDNMTALNKINKLSSQISSGKTLQNSYDDNLIYEKSLRLQSEHNSVVGIKNRTQQALGIANSADTAMNDFNDSLRKINTELIRAANSTMSEDNYKALATEIKAEKEYLISLANSSVDGKYIFSGTAIDTKPIDENGKYVGGDDNLSVVTDRGVTLDYSINGKSLFFGNDQNINKKVSTNVSLYTFESKDKDVKEYIKSDNTIKDLTGSDDTTYFYVSGIKGDGMAFKQKIPMQSTDTMEDLLSKIGKAYGNTATSDKVKVELNDQSNIVITDLEKGSSKLSFSMVGAVGQDENKLSDLTDVIEFTKSDLPKVTDSDASKQIDSFYFDKNENVLTGNVSLLVGDSFVTQTTKLKDISNGSLDGKTFKMNLVDINGEEKEVSINLSSVSSYSVDGNSYGIPNAKGLPTSADEFTMGQLEGVIAIVMAGEEDSGYVSGVKNARKVVDVSVNNSGKLEITDKSGENSDIKFSFYDSASDDFSTDGDSASLSFMSNNAITVADANFSFFEELDKVIESLENGSINISEGSRNPGIENMIGSVERLSTHFNTSHTQIGTMSNSITSANERATMLEITIKELQSEVEDIDIAEAITNLNQASTNYQAILSTVSKVNSLSLINYLK